MTYKLYCPDESSLFNLPWVYLDAISEERVSRITATTFKSKIRYRYDPADEWTEVEADDYTIEQDFDPNGINTFDWHHVDFTAEVASRYPPTITQPAIHEAGDIIPVGLTASYPGVTPSSINPVKVQPNYNCELEYVSNFGGCRKRTIQVSISSKHPDSAGKRCRTEEAGSSASNPAIKNISSPTLTEDTSKSPTVCNSFINRCKFTIYACGVPIFYKESEDCPEVERILCEAQLPESISVELNPNDTLFIIENQAGLLPPLIEILWANAGRIVRGLLFDTSILTQIFNQGMQNPEKMYFDFKS